MELSDLLLWGLALVSISPLVILFYYVCSFLHYGIKFFKSHTK